MGYDLHVCDDTGEPLATDYEDDRYLRRNIFGMGPLRDVLENLDIGYWPAGAGKSYPQGGDEADVMDWLRDTRDERPGIPLHKLCSNDGWWVTAAECKSALQLWESLGSPVAEEFRDDWIPFLRAAAANGGFRTY